MPKYDVGRLSCKLTACLDWKWEKSVKKSSKTDICDLQMRDKISCVGFLDPQTGLSMNILRVVQRGSFKNSVGDLLPALRFLGGLYDFYNFVIILS